LVPVLVSSGQPHAEGFGIHPVAVLVGDGVGVAVDVLGEGVGVTVGLGDGEMVGLALGLVVGVDDGDPVGLGVTAPPKMAMQSVSQFRARVDSP